MYTKATKSERSKAIDEQEICFKSLPIPRIKPHVSEVLMQTPTDGYFYILLNGMYAGSTTTAWMYIADDDGRARQFVDRSKVVNYLINLSFKGYNLDLVKVIQEFDFDKGGEFSEKTHTEMVLEKRKRGNGKYRTHELQG